MEQLAKAAQAASRNLDMAVLEIDALGMVKPGKASSPVGPSAAPPRTDDVQPHTGGGGCYTQPEPTEGVPTEEVPPKAVPSTSASNPWRRRRALQDAVASAPKRPKQPETPPPPWLDPRPMPPPPPPPLGSSSSSGSSATEVIPDPNIRTPRVQYGKDGSVRPPRGGKHKEYWLYFFGEQRRGVPVQRILSRDAFEKLHNINQ